MNERKIMCMYCKHDYMHRIRTDIFKRGEDEEKCLHIIVDEDGCLCNYDDNKLNPSDRRDGLIITFRCEECSKLTYLKIYQHKGNEFYETY